MRTFSAAVVSDGSAMPKTACEAFDTERRMVKEADALAQVFQISGDLVQSRLLISKVRELPFGYVTSCLCLARWPLP